MDERDRQVDLAARALHLAFGLFLDCAPWE